MSNSENTPKQYIDPKALSAFRETFWNKCKENGIVLEDLAERSELSYIQVYRIVRGTKNTSLSNVIAVIRAAGFQPRDVFTFDIDIPEYPPLRSQRINKEGKKLRKSPGPSFFIKEYIENGHFATGLSATELTKSVNEDLNKEFDEADFSTELGRFYDRQKLDRKKVNGTYHYFEIKE